MLEKILKLLDSPNIDDVLIGIELLRTDTEIDPIRQVFTSSNNKKHNPVIEKPNWWSRVVKKAPHDYYTPFKYGMIVTQSECLYYVIGWSNIEASMKGYKPLEEYGK